MPLIIAYIPCSNDREAEKISKNLLKKRIIACANIVKAKSLYFWKGSIVDGHESIIIAKSDKKKSKKIIEEVKRTHSYKLPCIEIIDSKANKEYEQWVKKTVSAR